MSLARIRSLAGKRHDERRWAGLFGFCWGVLRDGFLIGRPFQVGRVKKGNKNMSHSMKSKILSNIFCNGNSFEGDGLGGQRFFGDDKIQRHPPTKRSWIWGTLSIWQLHVVKKHVNKSKQLDNYLDLPRGAEWMIRGAYTPSLRVQTAPFGRCW